MIFLYFLIGLLASWIGSMAGLGGGVIIKPVLDFFGHYSLETIGILSAATVLAMSTVSLVRVRGMEAKINPAIGILIAIGSILGGFFGKAIFNFLVQDLGWERGTGIFQSALLAFILLLIYIYMHSKDFLQSFSIQHKGVIFLVGIILGALASFLGIGGGPLNVAVLYLLFSMSAKETVVNSTFIIFFAQLASLSLTAFTTGFEAYDLSLIWVMVAGGVIGGMVGGQLIRVISDKQIQLIFNVTLLLIIAMNIYNLFAY